VENSTVSFLSILFITQSAVFTGLFLIFYPRRREVYIWCISNIFASGSIAATALYISKSFTWAPTLSSSLALLGITIKSLAYKHENFYKLNNVLMKIILLLSFISIIFMFLFKDNNYNLFIITFDALIVSIISIIFLSSNKSWTGMKAKWISISNISIASLGLYLKLLRSYPLGFETKFITDSRTPILDLMILVLFSFIMQISFLGLVAERSARQQIFFERRSARLQARTIVLTQERQQLAQLAAERMSLLQMLTHEVRQPLNNAQAALQTIMMDISNRTRSPDSLFVIAQKAQSTVSEVILAISNSIVGASLINSTRKTAFVYADIGVISRLAVLDIDAAERHRISECHHDVAMFASVDPVLFRLAVRNLLENAIKFSPKGTCVIFDASVDEESMTASLSVRNTVEDQAFLTEDIFGFEKRASDNRHEGMGLGLFIVKKCADLHHGSVSYRLVGENIISFELTIPC
jgi:signal transduction histidine kinase